MKKEHLEKLEQAKKPNNRHASFSTTVDLPSVDKLVETYDAFQKEIISRLADQDEQITQLASKDIDFSSVINKLDEISNKLRLPDNSDILEALDRYTESIKANKPVINFTPPKVKEIEVDPRQKYQPADTATKTANKFYGYVAPDGKWFIMRTSGKEDQQIRYAVGKNNYKKEWRQRTSQDFKYYDQIEL